MVNLCSNTVGNNVKSGISNKSISYQEIMFTCFDNSLNCHKPKVLQSIIENSYDIGSKTKLNIQYMYINVRA